VHRRRRLDAELGAAHRQHALRRADAKARLAATRRLGLAPRRGPVPAARPSARAVGAGTRRDSSMRSAAAGAQAQQRAVDQAHGDVAVGAGLQIAALGQAWPTAHRGIAAAHGTADGQHRRRRGLGAHQAQRNAQPRPTGSGAGCAPAFRRCNCGQLAGSAR
jgi:hypothetical protein